MPTCSPFIILWYHSVIILQQYQTFAVRVWKTVGKGKSVQVLRQVVPLIKWVNLGELWDWTSGRRPSSTLSHRMWSTRQLLRHHNQRGGQLTQEHIKRFDELQQGNSPKMFRTELFLVVICVYKLHFPITFSICIVKSPSIYVFLLKSSGYKNIIL